MCLKRRLNVKSRLFPYTLTACATFGSNSHKRYVTGTKHEATSPVDLCSEREPIGVARAACFEELAGVFASSGALHYAKIFTSLNRKYFLLSAQNSVRQEIRQFIDGRCQKCSTKQQKQRRPTRNRAIRWWTVPELQCKTTETGASDRKSGNSLMDGVEKVPASCIHTGLQSWIFSHFLILFWDFTKFSIGCLGYGSMLLYRHGTHPLHVKHYQQAL